MDSNLEWCLSLFEFRFVIIVEIRNFKSYRLFIKFIWILFFIIVYINIKGLEF